MIKLVRGGVILSLFSMLAVVSVHAETETALNIANDSQSQVKNNTSDSTLVLDDKKLIKKTVLAKAAAPKPAAAASAAAAKGSFSATAYCLKGKTAMGHSVRKGLIAADPRVLKLGSRIDLGAGGYSGTYLVSDTGGKIKGRKLDIWMASCSEARKFGRRTVSVSSPSK